MLALVPTLFDLLMALQNAIHRAPMAQIFLFIQQTGVHLAGGLIDKAVAVKKLAYLVSFRRRQGSGWGWAGCRDCFGLSSSIQTAAGDTHQFTGDGNSAGFG
jgi:hypothetical protein